MPLLIKTYRIILKNVEGTDISIDITDTDTILFEGQSVEIIEMIGNGLTLSTTNNADDILQPILGAKLTVTFKNTTTENLNFFGSGEDNRFQVYVGAIGFKGFMVMDDNSEPYLPPGQDVTLVFTDNLGLLRDIELSDSAGAKIRGKQKIIKFVYECLLKTGHDLEIYVMNNLYEDSHSDRTADIKNCPWDQTYVNANLFSSGINQYVDCYTVLEEILFSWGCRLHQYMGAWWIMRLDEYKESNNLSSSLMYYTRYIGGAVATGHSAILEKTIDTDVPGAPVDRHVFGDPAIVTTQRPFKSVKLELPFDLPEERISNMNFERGAFSSPLSGAGYSAFDIEDWTLKRGFPGTPITINASAYIRRTFDANGYEDSRYGVVTWPSNTDVRPPYIESLPIEVCIKDKFEGSVDYRFASEISTGGGFYKILYFILHGDDGSWWLLGNDEPTNTAEMKWYNTANWTVFTNKGEVGLNFGVDTDIDWRTISFTAPPIPVTGELFVWLHGANTDAAAYDNVNIYYSNLSFDYHKEINGTYVKYTGESYKVSRPENYSAKREDVLWMGDLPCKPYKRAMFTLSGTYSLTNAWLDWKLANASPAPVVSTPNRFAWWQAFAMWNQYRLGKRIFQGSWKGIDSGTAQPLWLLHRIKITTLSEHNRNRKFIFLSMEQDLYRCTYSGVLAEIDNIGDPRSFAETLEFKYLLTG